MDLTAVEEALLAAPGVASAAAVERGGALFAFVVPSPAAGGGAARGGSAEAAAGGAAAAGASALHVILRAACVATLPPYAVPSAFIPVPSLPIGPTGKCDRKRLRVPTGLEGSSGESSAGACEEGVHAGGSEGETGGAVSTEEGCAAGVAPVQTQAAALLSEVSAIFAAALPHPPAGGSVAPSADFFLLGGHSLAAASLMGSLLRRFGPAAGAAVSLGAFLSNPTPLALARRLAAALGVAAPEDQGAGVQAIRAANAPDDELIARDLSLDLSAPASATALPVVAAAPTGRLLLLTGATGFLGSHLLVRLLRELAGAGVGKAQQPRALDVVMCVVRSRGSGGTAAAMSRLRDAAARAAGTEAAEALLAAFDAALEAGHLRVHLGDLAEERLGFTEGAPPLSSLVTLPAPSLISLLLCAPLNCLKLTSLRHRGVRGRHSRPRSDCPLRGARQHVPFLRPPFEGQLPRHRPAAAPCVQRQNFQH